jgi:MoxR-like ATPase
MAVPAPVVDRDWGVEDMSKDEAMAALAALAGVPLAEGTITPIAPAAPVAPAAPAVKVRRLPEPEELLSKAQLAQWARAEAAIRCAILPTRVMLWGRPGTGKTQLPWNIAAEMGWSHHYQLMSEETPGTELLGHLAVQAGNTVWCDGSLGRALRASQVGPTVLVIDEIGRASADAMTACLLALTNPESLRLTLRSGEVLAPKPENWHVVATSNDEPKMLPPALEDRLHINVRVDAPHPGLVRSLTTVEARRAACATSAEYSVRALLTYDRLRAGGMTLEEAAGMVWEPATASSFVDAAKLEGGRK